LYSALHVVKSMNSVLKIFQVGQELSLLSLSGNQKKATSDQGPKTLSSPLKMSFVVTLQELKLVFLFLLLLCLFFFCACCNISYCCNRQRSSRLLARLLTLIWDFDFQFRDTRPVSIVIVVVVLFVLFREKCQRHKLKFNKNVTATFLGAFGVPKWPFC